VNACTRHVWMLSSLVLLAGCPQVPMQVDRTDDSAQAEVATPMPAPSSSMAEPRTSEEEEDADASVPEPESDSMPMSRAPMSAAPAPRPPRPRPSAGPSPDLRLEVRDPDRSVSFREVRFTKESCEVLDGCARDLGMRSLMAVDFTLRNDGDAPLEIGFPSKSDLFQSSRCDDAHIAGLFAAELLDDHDRIVSSGALATKCIRTDNDSYSCSSQGVGQGEVSTQPLGRCDFLDITGVEAGRYTLRVTVNPDYRIDESDFDNNTLEWKIRVEPPGEKPCDHIRCGGECCPVGASCDGGMCTLPDLRVNYEAAADRNKLRVVERSFAVDSGELEEACVGGPGKRRLLLFEGRLENWGPGDLDLGPQEDNPLFVYSECHDHYHTQNFAEYLLLNKDGSLAARGHKQGYCVADSVRIGDSSSSDPERPPPGRGTPCNRLTAGYADVYNTDTPCQWIDITEVDPGDYLLEVTINPDGHVAETNTKNNTIQVPLTLTQRGVR